MKCILRGYGVNMTVQEKQLAKAQAINMTITTGTGQAPQPPRDLICQPGPRGILLTWNLPSGFNTDIQRWRVYRGDENTLYAEIADRGTRQCFVEATAGSSPPLVNLFVSSINTFGRESAKVQVQGVAATEAGAPTMPNAPPGYSSGGSGGGDTSGGNCFTGDVPIRTPHGLVKFQDLPSTYNFRIINKTGEHPARLVPHRNYKGMMIVLEGLRMVTLGHDLKMPDGNWQPAKEKYPDLPQILFEGIVYNLHVLSKDPEDWHYILWNGDVAHNFRKV
jgi:hypothetical protein